MKTGNNRRRELKSASGRSGRVHVRVYSSSPSSAASSVAASSGGVGSNPEASSMPTSAVGVVGERGCVDANDRDKRGV
jgi:hypothetical protein